MKSSINTSIPLGRLAQRMNTLRLARRMTQKEVCMRAKVSPRTMSVLEGASRRSTRIPKLITLRRVVDLYGVTAAEWAEVACLWAKVRLGEDAAFLRIEPMAVCPVPWKEESDIIRRAGCLIAAATPAQQAVALRLVESPKLLDCLAEWCRSLNLESPKAAEAVAADTELLNASQLALRMNRGRSYIYSMRRAGFKFPYGMRTTLQAALEWLRAHPGFKANHASRRQEKRASGTALGTQTALPVDPSNIPPGP